MPLNARSEAEVMAYWRLNELRKSWHVEIYTHPDSGDAVVELFPSTRNHNKGVGRPDVTDMAARYVEQHLYVAIGRAWAGEPADG